MALGHSFDMQGYRARIFGGGYYYHSALDNTSLIKGALAGVQLPLNHYADVLVTNSYNNIFHNSVALTLRLSWGAERHYSKEIQDRLLDRIERHNGIIDSGAAALAQKGFAATGRQGVYRNNIWFFESTATPPGILPNSPSTATCTLEHPCTDFNQERLNQIQSTAPGASLYLASGNYALSQNSALKLNSGLSLYGRQVGFKAPAIGTQRPVLHGALWALGTNNIESMRVQNNGVVSITTPNGPIVSALSLPDSLIWQTVWVRDSQFNAFISSSTQPGSAVAVSAGSGFLNLTNSQLTGVNLNAEMTTSEAGSLLTYNQATVNASYNSLFAQSNNVDTYGVQTLNSSTLNLHHNTIGINSTSAAAYGLFAAAGSKLTFDNNTFTVTMNNRLGNSYGVLMKNNARLNSSNDAFTVNSPNSDPGVKVRGFYMQDASNLQVQQDTLTVQAQNAQVTGVDLYNTSQLTMSNTKLNALLDSTNKTQITGTYAHDFSTLVLNKNSFSVSGKGNALTTGLAASNNSSLDSAHNSFIVEGNNLSETTGLGLKGLAKVHSENDFIEVTSVGPNSASGTALVGISLNEEAEAIPLISKAQVIVRGDEHTDFMMGIYQLSCSPTIIDSSILVTGGAANSAMNGLRLIGGLTTLTNNQIGVFANNRGAKGVGIKTESGNLKSTDNRFTVHTSDSTYKFGVGFYASTIGLFTSSGDSFNLRGMNVPVVGFYGDDLFSLAFHQANIAISGTAGSAITAAGPDGFLVSFDNKSRCSINGSTVTC